MVPAPTRDQSDKPYWCHRSETTIPSRVQLPSNTRLITKRCGIKKTRPIFRPIQVTHVPPRVRLSSPADSCQTIKIHNKTHLSNQA